MVKRSPSPGSAAFSLVEIVVVVAVLGILTGIGVMSFKRVTETSREVVASNVVETLNNATKEFGHAQYNLSSAGENDNADDEVHLLQTLQWRDPSITYGVAGPFMRQDWIPATSDLTSDYRAVWTGGFWKLAIPGQEGAGLKIDFDAADVGTLVTFDSDWQPVNASASNLGSPSG